MRGNAIPLTLGRSWHGFADLEPLRAIIGDARIVSLGEATHGTREFFQLKHRLLEFCVSELGFTIFAIEASYPECLRVNDYVLNGTGSPADALASQRFWTWDTEEVLALIEWMRGWNRTHARKVKFYGFDMQFPTEAALGLLDYLKRVAPDQLLPAQRRSGRCATTSQPTGSTWSRLRPGCRAGGNRAHPRHLWEGRTGLGCGQVARSTGSSRA
jgi:erythromycin esterase-like protein